VPWPMSARRLRVPAGADFPHCFETASRGSLWRLETSFAREVSTFAGGLADELQRLVSRLARCGMADAVEATGRSITRGENLQGQEHCLFDRRNTWAASNNPINLEMCVRAPLAVGMPFGKAARGEVSIRFNRLISPRAWDQGFLLNSAVHSHPSDIVTFAKLPGSHSGSAAVPLRRSLVISAPYEDFESCFFQLTLL
jgi:hypothetical protein